PGAHGDQHHARRTGKASAEGRAYRRSSATQIQLRQRTEASAGSSDAGLSVRSNESVDGTIDSRFSRGPQVKKITSLPGEAGIAFNIKTHCHTRSHLLFSLVTR